jgi:hypothetical protein
MVVKNYELRFKNYERLAVIPYLPDGEAGWFAFSEQDTESRFPLLFLGCRITVRHDRKGRLQSLFRAAKDRRLLAMTAF